MAFLYFVKNLILKLKTFFFKLAPLIMASSMTKLYFVIWYSVFFLFFVWLGVFTGGVMKIEFGY